MGGWGGGGLETGEKEGEKNDIVDENTPHFFILKKIVRYVLSDAQCTFDGNHQLLYRRGLMVDKVDDAGNEWARRNNYTVAQGARVVGYKRTVHVGPRATTHGMTLRKMVITVISP